MSMIRTDAVVPVPEDMSLAKHPFRGLIQCISVLIFVLMVTAVFWCIWAVIGHRRLQKQIDAIAALHQPFRIEDFAAARAADSETPAAMWRQAFSALPADDKAPSNSNLQFKDYPPFPPAWHQLEDQSILLNAKVFELAHTAATISAIDWGNGSASFASSPDYNRARETANVLGDAIVHAHLHGNDALAIQRAGDVLELARTEGSGDTLIGKLVATGIMALLSDRLLMIAPDLDAANVPRAQVFALIGLLLDESGESRQRIASIDYERMYSHQQLETERKQRWLLGPMIDLSEVRVLEQLSVDRLAAEATSEFDAGQIYASHPTAIQSRSSVPPQLRWGRVYDDMFSPLDRYIITQWKGIADRRMAAIALGVRLYREDHGGWPGSLAELVPAYLSAVPADPFLPQPASIGYVMRKNALPGAIDRPMLYFNLSGDPRSAILSPEPCFSWTWSRNSASPQWRDLSRWYPVPPSANPTLPGGFMMPPSPR